MGIESVNEETELMIVDCLKRRPKLSEWECEFVNSIYGKTKLTDKQQYRLDSIWERVTK